MNLTEYHKTQSTEAQREAIKEKINALNREIELLEIKKSQATFDIAQKLIDIANLRHLHSISIKDIQKALNSINSQAIELAELIPDVETDAEVDTVVVVEEDSQMEPTSTNPEKEGLEKAREEAIKEHKRLMEIKAKEQKEVFEFNSAPSAPSAPSTPVAAEPAPSAPSTPVATESAPSAPSTPVAAEPAPSAPSTPVATESAPSAPSTPVAAESAPSAPSTPVAAEPAPSAPSTPPPSAPSAPSSPVKEHTLAENEYEEMDADAFAQVLKQNRN